MAHSEWHQLAEEVAQGNLRLKISREALDAVAKYLQDYIDTIDELLYDVREVANVTGFGGFKIGLELAAKFTAMGSGPDSIQQRLHEYQEEARLIQDTIRKAAAAYADMDQNFAQGLRGVQQP